MILVLLSIIIDVFFFLLTLFLSLFVAAGVGFWLAREPAILRRKNPYFPLAVRPKNTYFPKIFIGPSEKYGAVFLFAFKDLLKQNCLRLVCYMLQYFYSMCHFVFYV